MFLDVPYPRDRTGLHFYFLFLAGFFFMVDEVRWKPFSFTALAAAIPLLSHLLVTLNTCYVPGWKHEGVPFAFYEHMLRWQKENARQSTISAVGLLGGVIDYYDFRNGTQLNTPQDLHFPDTLSDFIITNRWQSTIAGYDTALCEPETGVALLVRNRMIRWKPAFTVQNAGWSTVGGFMLMCEVPVDSLRGLPVCIETELTLQSGYEPFQGWITCQVYDTLGNTMNYPHVDLQWIAPDYFTRPQKLRRRFVPGYMTPEIGRISVMLWGIPPKPYSVSGVKVEVLVPRE
jgi:hypothetical protein